MSDWKPSIEEAALGAVEDVPPPTSNGANAAASPEPWPKLVPLDDVGDLPPFPIDALPRILRDWVAEVSSSKETPPELAAGLGLAVISAIVHKRFVVQVREGWREPLSTWWVISLPPAERKSAVFGDATAPIKAWERAQAKACAPKISAARTRREIKEKQLQKAKEDAARSADPIDAQNAAELAVELGEVHVPVAPRIIASDVTPEALGALMYEQGGRMAVMSPEATFFEILAGRYSDAPNLEIALHGHAGEQVQIDRRGSTPIHIQNAALTLGVCVQPDVIDKFGATSGFRGRGLLARCLFVLPRSRLGSRRLGQPAADERAVHAYERLCTTLLELPEQREAQEISATVLHFAHDADRGVLAWEREIEPRLKEDADLEPIRDWAGKLAGATVRIAGLLAMIERADSAVSEVDAGHVQRAIEIARFLILHALTAHRAMGADPTVNLARRILGWVERKGLTSFSQRDAWQQLKRKDGAVRTAAQLEPAVRLLVEHGYIRAVVARPTRRSRGRPPDVYEVRPDRGSVRNVPQVPPK